LAMRRAQVGEPCAPDAVGVLPVEDRAVLAWVGDVVAHAGQSLERVEGLEVTAQGWVHAGAVEDSPVVVEVHELLQGQGVSDEVGGGVLEVVLVLGSIGSPTCAEKPGCRQARSLRTSSWEMAWRSTSRARSLLRKSLMRRVRSHFDIGKKRPCGVKPPSVVRRWGWGCHCRRSPAVAREATRPGRVSGPVVRRTSSAVASAPARASSVRSSRRRRNSGRSRRGMVSTRRPTAARRPGSRGSSSIIAATGKPRCGRRRESVRALKRPSAPSAPVRVTCASSGA